MVGSPFSHLLSRTPAVFYLRPLPSLSLTIARELRFRWPTSPDASFAHLATTSVSTESTRPDMSPWASPHPAWANLMPLAQPAVCAMSSSCMQAVASVHPRLRLHAATMRRGCCFVNTWSFGSYSGISTLLQSMVEHRMPNHGIDETSLPCPMYRTCAALIRSLIVRSWPPRVHPCISISLIDPEPLLRTVTFTARTQLFPLLTCVPWVGPVVSSTLHRPWLCRNALSQ